MIRSIRVASWNLHEGLPDGADGMQPVRDTREDMVTLLADHQVDLVALQEVPFDEGGRSAILQAVRERTPLTHIATNSLSESSFFPGHRSGVALASRNPLFDIERCAFPNPKLTTMIGTREIDSHEKGMVSATMMLGQTPVSVVSLHAIPFHLFGREADDVEFNGVWSSIATELGRFATHPLIVCGDFNTPQRDLVLDRQPRVLNRAVGDRATYRDKALDDILYTPELATRRTEVFRNFSDHALCLAEFYLR